MWFVRVSDPAITTRGIVLGDPELNVSTLCKKLLTGHLAPDLNYVKLVLIVVFAVIFQSGSEHARNENAL